MAKAGLVSRDSRREPPAADGKSSQSPGPAFAVLCLLTGLTPLIFAATLFDPYTGAKEILIEFGAPTVVLLWLWATRLNGIAVTPLWSPLIAIAAIGMTSCLWSSHPAISLDEAQHFIPYFLLFFSVLHLVRYAVEREALASLLVLGASIEAVYVLLQFVIGDPIFLTEGLPGKWQTFGTFGNPNWTGEFLAAAALIGLGRGIDLAKARGSNPWPRRVIFAAFILMFLGLTATLARGAWLGFASGVVCLFLLLWRNDRKQVRWRAIMPLMIAGAAIAATLLVSVFLRSETRNYLLNFKSVRGRTWIWSVTADMIRDAPLVGHGLGTFRMQFPLYQAQAFADPGSTPFISNASFTSFAHNDLLQMAAELGLLGSIALGIAFWIVLRRGPAIAGEPLTLGYWAAVLSLGINALIAFPLHMPASLMLVAVCLGVVEAAAGKARQRPLRSVGVRFGVAIPLIFACLLAYYAGYEDLRSESALWRAEASLATGDSQAAEVAAIASINDGPTRPDGYAILGRIRLERGDNSGAIDLFDRAMELGFDADVYVSKTKALERAGRIASAIDVANELVRLRPDLESARRRLAELNALAQDQQEDQP